MHGWPVRTAGCLRQRTSHPQLSDCMLLPAVGICTRWLAGEYPSAKVRGWALVCSQLL